MDSNRTVFDSWVQNFEQVVKLTSYISQIYLPPVIIVSGLLGNFFSYKVMNQAKYANVVAAFYIRAFAILEAFVIVTTLGQRYFITFAQPYLIANPVFRNWFCLQYWSLLYYSSTHMEWIMVAMTVERYIGITFPLKARGWWTLTRAKVSVLTYFLKQ